MDRSCQGRHLSCGHMSTTLIADALDRVTLGPETVVHDLTMIPLLAPSDERVDRGYVTLDEALERGDLRIVEVSDQGRVPDLLVVNRGPLPVLIVDGEELVGAKQNRVVNLSILVPAAAEVTIPVSCVEAGRWAMRSREFSSAPRTQYASGRMKRMRQVTESIVGSGARFSDQAEVWADIAEKAARLDAKSDTSAMAALFSGHAVSIDAFVVACAPIEKQVGAVFAIDGRIAGMELFDSPVTLRALLPKIVRGYAIDAIDRRLADARGSAVRSVRPQAERFVASVSASAALTAPAVGLGSDVRLSGAGIIGAALTTDHVLHLIAFAG